MFTAGTLVGKAGLQPAGCNDSSACCWCTGQGLKGLFAVSTPPHIHTPTIERPAAITMASLVALAGTQCSCLQLGSATATGTLRNRACSLGSWLRGLVEGTADILVCRVISLLPQGRNHFRVVLVLFRVPAGCIRATLEGFLLRHEGWMKWACRVIEY